ncbi:MAG: hypothetical protein HKN47_21375 [Pirellulaceae bacterium]|nr:hypothetical protein [Pirellulaceae bacterium]
MFVEYQKIRNTVLATVAAGVAGVAAFFGVGGGEAPVKTKPTAEVAQQARPAVSVELPPVDLAAVDLDAVDLAAVESNDDASSPRPLVPATSTPVAQASAPANQPTVQMPVAEKSSTGPIPTSTAVVSDEQRYVIAMKFALGQAAESGTAKDVLGAASPWKLNLYDDDKDGRYDRGKLDKNRDDLDDEKWNFKQGRWEKDGGLSVWADDKWVGDAGAEPSKTEPNVTPDLRRYRAALAIATARADRSGKGKDVLGPASPWKLNLYDDDKDGQWDRAKLDTNRDDVDDEKWNFKKGRWEKSGGSPIWNGSDWVEE